MLWWREFSRGLFRSAALDAEAAEAALGLLLQLLVRLRVEVGRVRVEAGEHAVDGLGEQLLVRHFLDIAALDRAEHLGEGAHFLELGRAAWKTAVARE